jgi:hypothetical protein
LKAVSGRNDLFVENNFEWMHMTTMYDLPIIGVRHAN